MQFSAINERVAGIKNNESEINRFVEEYKPFIASCAGKMASRYMKYGRDDELSIAMMAFVEAIKSFDHTKGNFLPFSQNVIKRRLIDYYRKEKHNDNIISLNEYCKEDEEDFDLSSGESMERYSSERLNENRKLELEELKKELAKRDISFFDLAEVSPKQSKTRNACREIAGLILSRPDFIKLILDKGYIPVAEIEKVSKVPRKIIERSRKYIIAVVIISTGDYQYIRDYIDV